MPERTLTELEDAITEGAARIDAATCRWLLDLAEFDRRAGFESWECRSTAHFLNWRCGISLRTARDHVRVARTLDHFHQVRDSFADGRLSYSKVRAITRVVTPETEAQLVEWALCATAAHIDKLVAGRNSVNRREKPDRFVSWSETDGSFEIRARLSPEEGALVVAALQAARAALSTRPDQKSGSAEPLSDPALQPTNADALVAMAETVLAHGPTPVNGGDRHMVLVHLNVATGEKTLESGHVLDPESAAMICCDAGTATIMLGEEGEPLAMGRKSRDPSVAQRCALHVRDQGCCRFPGCTQRLFVDAHHVDYWEFGGLTDLDNLVLLCRVHHRAIHHRGYRIQKGLHQTFRFFRPDGLELIPSPAAARPHGAMPSHGPTGRAITPDTPIPNWDGYSPDYATAVEGLLWLEENAHKLEEQPEYADSRSG